MSTVRRRGWERSDGTKGEAWQAVWRVSSREATKSGFETKYKAKVFAEQQEAMVRQGTYVDPKSGNLSLGELADRWVSMQLWRESTTKRVGSVLNNHILPTFGDRPIRSIHHSDVQRWIKELTEELAPSTVHGALGYLKAIFDTAVRDRFITINPCVDVKLPKKTTTELAPLTVEQAKALTEATEPRYRNLMITLVGTGLRISEALALTWDRIDKTERVIIVDRQLLHPSGQGWQFGPPKTPASVRTVPVSELVLDAFEEQAAVYGSDTQFVFTDPNGHPLRRNRVTDTILKKARIKAALPYVKTHDLRHFYTSCLIHEDASLKALQKALGHSDARETLNTYGHLWDKDHDTIRSGIDRAFGVGDKSRHLADIGEARSDESPAQGLRGAA